MNNMYFKRIIDEQLIDWKHNKSKKPIIIRGARQVGKSSAVRKLSTSYEYFIEVNFDFDKNVHYFFNNTLDPDVICSRLSIYYNTPIVPEKTLLFFDEIQSCVPAISSLRFFYEKRPDIHIVAAGSLLEFALKEIPSYGVGRIQSLFLYPFSFDEFLTALGEHELLKLKREANSENPMLKPFHDKLTDYLKIFIILGGLPEVVKMYVKSKDFLSCDRILNDLVTTYIDDFSKYKSRIHTTHLTTVFRSVAKNAGQKFMYSHVSDQMYTQQIKDCIDLLTLAGIIHPVTHTAANGIPLGAEANIKYRKFIPFDTGIALKLLNLSMSDFLFDNDFSTINKGYLAEVFAGLEMIKYSDSHSRHQLYYWQRQDKTGNAEIDYVIQNRLEIIPLEIKAGTKGSMQSMHYFMQVKNIKKGIRASLENFAEYDNIKVMPLYALSNLHEA